MTKPITLSIFFPAYNEEENIRPTVEKTVRVVEDSPYIRDYEILIVNDGSSDGTKRAAEALAHKYPKVRVINHESNLGYGEALRTGIDEAKMEYVFFTDADLQFDILELQNLLLHIPQNDVVIGYRAPRRDPAMRLLNAWGWNRLNRLLFGLRITDIDCAFKLFRRDQVQSLTLKSRGAMISAETLIRLERVGARIKEIPVTHLPRVWGSATGAKPSVIARALREMVALYTGDLGATTSKQALRFMSVGVVNTAIDVVAYVVLTRETLYFSEHLVVAKFVTFLFGTVSSLLLNRGWTFGMKGRLSLGEVARFYATVSISLIINVEGMNILVSMGMYDLVALVCTVGITFVANFLISKFWIFRPTSAREKEERPVLVS